MTDFVIAGAGLGGALMATMLGRAGHRVELLERRPDLRGSSRDEGRSINLAISARGLDALGRVGLADAVLERAIPLAGRMVHPVHGPLAFQPYGRKGQAINSISRRSLNEILLDAAARSGEVALRFERRCTEVDLAGGRVATVDPADGNRQWHRGVLIGADGAGSAIRAALVSSGGADARQEPLEHGYKELRLPAGPGGSFLLERHALHIWPRGGYMMMAMANLDGTFTVTLYLAQEGANSFASLDTPERLRAFFRRDFPDAVPLLPGLEEDFFRRPVGSLVTVRTSRWHAGGTAVLLGDAAHAIVPFFGQGANAAFEDCVALEAALRRHGSDTARAFEEYEAERRPNANAIADLALQNFLEMRDKVASPWFRVEKRLEALVHRLLPGWFLPLYTMISFTTIPYAEARRRAARQRLVVRGTLFLAAVLILLLIFGLIADG